MLRLLSLALFAATMLIGVIGLVVLHTAGSTPAAAQLIGAFVIGFVLIIVVDLRIRAGRR